MEKLKPCPFCGWKAILHTHHGEIYIGCANDKCFIHMHKFETETKAIESWNKRAK
jgi:Lar family restriction alleviation protein